MRQQHAETLDSLKTTRQDKERIEQKAAKLVHLISNLSHVFRTKLVFDLILNYYRNFSLISFRFFIILIRKVEFQMRGCS